MKYSIITINFNNKDGLRKTIESVVNQTYKDFEYIIIDGGSTDGSVEVIKEYADKIDYWVSEPDKGIYNAMNKGILQAHGEYLNFMNSGDCFHNETVLCHVDKFSAFDIFVGRVSNLDANGDYQSLNIEAKRISMFHFYISTFPHQGCFIKHTLFKEFLYDETLKIVGDWKFFVECVVFQNCKVLQSSIIVADCEYRGASNNFSMLLEEKEKVLRNIMPYGIYKDYEHLSLLGISAYDNLVYTIQYPRLRKFLSRILQIIVSIHRLFLKH